MVVQRLTASCRDGFCGPATSDIYQVLASGSESFIFSWHCPNLKISLSKPGFVHRPGENDASLSFLLILAVADALAMDLVSRLDVTVALKSVVLDSKQRHAYAVVVLLFGC